MGKYRNIKIRVGNPETSRKVQEKLFEDGCWWRHEASVTPRRLDDEYLYVGFSGEIVHGVTEEFFVEDSSRELTPAEILGEAEEWDGEGLPPVGTTVEYNADGEWCVCEIVAIKENVAIYWDYTLWEAGKLLAGDCRPIRTEAEKQREADRDGLLSLMGRFNSDMSIEFASDLLSDAILDAGFTRSGEK